MRCLRRSGLTGTRRQNPATAFDGPVRTFGTAVVLVVQVKEYASEDGVSSHDTLRFVGDVRPEHGADGALFVTTGRVFTEAALGLAVHRDVLDARDRAARPLARPSIPRVEERSAQRGDVVRANLAPLAPGKT
ncbi:restriction endonuclease [Streptomyces sp. NPDC050504]|uniref:restriction endonuclease n=1 Tax=Streptomyces sp. NPDC050504 TaxID=3365618 RepID=UPI003791E781